MGRLTLDRPKGMLPVRGSPEGQSCVRKRGSPEGQSRVRKRGSPEGQSRVRKRGNPLLEIQIRWLHRQGFRHVFLALGYLAEKVREYFKEGRRLGVHLEYSIEEKPLGTAGALKKMEPGLSRSFLAVFGDIYPRMNLAPLLRFHGPMS